MTRAFLLLFFFIPIAVFCDSYKPGDTLYVWNIDGTALMSEASEKSAQIAIVNVGSTAIVLGGKEEKLCKIVLKDSFILEGRWTKVRVNNKEGYIFDGDCFKAKYPIVGDPMEKTEILLDKVFGKKIEYIKEKRVVTNNNNELEVTDHIILYEQGKYIYTLFDGCYDHTYIFPNLSFNHAYHLMMNIFLLQDFRRGELDRPVFLIVEDGIYKFSGTGPTGEIQIRLKAEGIDIYSYDCD